ICLIFVLTLRRLHSFPTRRSSDLQRDRGIHRRARFPGLAVCAEAPMIEIDNVSFARQGTPVLQDISVSIPAGGVTALVGPNGARSEEHTSELQSREKLVCRLLLAK